MESPHVWGQSPRCNVTVAGGLLRPLSKYVGRSPPNYGSGQASCEDLAADNVAGGYRRGLEGHLRRRCDTSDAGSA